MTDDQWIITPLFRMELQHIKLHEFSHPAEKPWCHWDHENKMGLFGNTTQRLVDGK